VTCALTVGSARYSSAPISALDSPRDGTQDVLLAGGEFAQRAGQPSVPGGGEGCTNVSTSRRVIPAAVLTAVVAHWFPHWADPAYAEAAFYVGVALLGARAGAPDRQPVAPVPIPATS
jgi:hypothetical protein